MRRAKVLIGIVTAALLCGTAAGGAEASAEATRLLERAGVDGGLVVHLGCGDGKLTAALRANDRYLVHGLAGSAEEVSAAREHVRSAGLYGAVTVDRLTGSALPYRDNLVTLLISSAEPSVGKAEVLRVLAPGGVWLAGAGEQWRRTVKPRPEDIDEWTHFLHGPDNNAVAMDERVGPPRHLQWKAGPMWCRSHEFASSIAAMVTANGRLISVIDEGIIGQPRGVPALWHLVCRDAFNGVLLWKRKLPGNIATRGLAVAGDRLLLAPGRRKQPLEVLDAATGEPIGTCEGTEGAREVVVLEGTAVVSCQRAKENVVAAADIATRKLRWSHEAPTVSGDTLAAAEGRVFYFDGSGVVCRALDSGSQLWRQQSKGKARRRGGMLMVYRGSVIHTSGGMQAYSAATGEKLWDGPGAGGRSPSMFGCRGLVWRALAGGHGRSFLWTPDPTVRQGRDPATGEVKREVKVPCLVTPGHHWRCYPPKATDRFLLLHKRGVEFLDLDGNDHMRHNWLRAPCRHGVMPGNGLLYMPPSQCFCYPGVKLSGFFALSSTVEGPDDAAAGPRRTRGPAWPAPEGVTKAARADAEASADWPMYRHDARRSGRAGCDAPTMPARKWAVDLGGAVTAPVAADGRVIVAEEDAGIVHCFAAADGKRLWSHVAGGRVDSAPTIVGPAVLFGAADGTVTCLRADDGREVWRFRAAPSPRKIVAFGRLESPWPVHGTVMIHRGLAYVTAGRSSYLDGGIYVWALDPATGEVRHRHQVWSGRPDVNKDAGRPFDMEGTRTDILVSDGEDLYMLHARFSPELSPKPTPRITKLGDREVGLHLMATDGFLDKTWFNRTYWTYSRRWPGYYFSYKGPKTGQILVFDDEATYGLHVFEQRHGHSPEFRVGEAGYQLFADRNSNEPVLPPTEAGREKGLGYYRRTHPKWATRIPVRVTAMVLAGEKLIVAGPPDEVPADDPMASFEGRLGGRLWVVRKADGEKLADVALDAMPVFDGMIAAGGKLFLSTHDGRVVCMGDAQADTAEVK